MANPSYSEIVTTTIQNRSRKVADNVTNNNAILRELSKRGRIRTFSGGNVIIQELSYAENGNFTRYSGYDPIGVAATDVLTAAEYSIKQAAVAVVMSGLEMLQNAGREKFIDLLDARMEVAENTMKNNISADIYSTGTASGGKQIGGLQLIVADVNTNSVGGIDANTYVFWRNQVRDATATTGAVTAANVQDHMNKVYLSTLRGSDKGDLWIMDNNYYGFFWSSLQAIQRITSPETGNAGYNTLLFNGIPVIPDGGKGGNCPTNHAYLLNLDYLMWRPHADRNFTALEPDRYATNQDAIVKLMGWAGNLTCSNRSLQAVLID